MWETELGRGRAVQLPQPFQFGSSLRQNLGREGRGGVGLGVVGGVGQVNPVPLSPVPSWKLTWRKSLARACLYPGPSRIAQISG